MTLREMDDLLCEWCAVGARRYNGSTYDERCVDCVADEFVVTLPASGLFEGFWGPSQDAWRCERETALQLLPTSAFAHYTQPWAWETWIEEPRIDDGTVRYLTSPTRMGATVEKPTAAVRKEGTA